MSRSDTNGNSTLQDYIKMLKPYKEAGKINVLYGPTQIFPGIRSQPSLGHTPGHIFFILERKGQRLVFWGDIVHVAEVQFTDPYISVIYDSNASKAKYQRLKVLSVAVKKAFLVASPHITFLGLGHVILEGHKYKWVPVPYSPE